jgi:hypothetical protein
MPKANYHRVVALLPWYCMAAIFESKCIKAGCGVLDSTIAAIAMAKVNNATALLISHP